MPPPSSKHLEKNPRLPKTRGINKSWCLFLHAPKARRAQEWITPQPRVVKGAIKKCALITEWGIKAKPFARVPYKGRIRS